MKSGLFSHLPGVSSMAFPRASQALSRFTVLDLTRVRSGPTCVRQLADWGANVIKIDALMEDAPGEQPGGPRHGSDFQNLHRNKRAMTLNLKDPRGLEVFRRLVEEYGILVRDVSGAAGLEECLRVTAGTTEDVDAVVGALAAILGRAS